MGIRLRVTVHFEVDERGLARMSDHVTDGMSDNVTGINNYHAVASFT